MLDWQTIDTVLLDMDGTLLDLHYDNHFWLAHVPQRYAEKHSLPLATARQALLSRYARVAGTMEWYCVDYWSRELGLDIARLKREVAHLIAVHPHVEPFLSRVRERGKRVVLVTNAHQVSLTLKLERTELDRYFDAIVCAHECGRPKEHPEFWPWLAARESFAPGRTLLIDDSLPVLRAARAYGIRHLLAVARPDSQAPAREAQEFPLLLSFADILPP
jgi:putative hydrolase of the HAD superfamily